MDTSEYDKAHPMPEYKIQLPPPDAWKCDLFGCGSAFQLRRPEGKQPNWFWRRMQYLLIGNKWTRL